MAHTLTTNTVTEAGTKETKTELKTVEILIGIIPGQPMSLRFYYANCEKVTLTPLNGDAPTVSERPLDRVGMAEASEAEMKALPSFAAVYADLKALADAKAAEKWPEIVNP